MIASVLAAALLAAPDGGITFRPAVEVAGEEVTFGEVADLGALPSVLKAKASALRVARLAAGREADVPVRRIAERARAQLPALGPWLSPAADGSVRLRRAANMAPAPAPEAPRRPCVRVLRAIAAAEHLQRVDVEPTACPVAVAEGVLRLDRATGLARAAVPLSEGRVILAPPRAALAEFSGGQTFTMSAAVGPVRVERPVTAVRPAGPAARVVVRDTEGRVHVVQPPKETRP